MELKDQVLSLELSKRLKELGCPQESLWYWQHNITGVRKGQKNGTVPYIFHSETKEIVDKESIEHFNDDYSGNYRTERFHYSAFTVAELGEALPEVIRYDGDNFYLRYYKDCVVYHHNRRCNIKAFDNNEANARAKMLIYLLENNLMEKPK